MPVATKRPSTLAKMLAEYHAVDTSVKAQEEWAKGVSDHKDTFKKLVIVQSKWELALRRHFRDLARNRVNKMVNWTQYQVDSIKAYDYVVNLDDYDFTDEQDLLSQIMIDYIGQSMALGIGKANDVYVHSGLSPTSESVQKAARERSAKLVTQITESTRNRIQQSITTSLQIGETVPEAQDRLAGIIDDPGRAETIARTETRNSYVDGSNQVALETGATEWTWDPSSAPCELCQENVDAGTIPIDEDFPNGMDPHPNCLCGDPIYGYGNSESGDG